MKRHLTLVVGLALCSPPAASIAFAQAPDQSQIDQLRQRIDLMQQQMLDELARLRQELAKTEAQAVARQLPAPPPPSLPVGDAQAETFSRDRETVARVDNAVGVADRAFLSIPGTPARFKVDGYAKLDTIVDGKPAGNPDQFIPSSMPVGLSDALQTASTNLHVRQTRLNLDFRSPTELGEFRTFAEIDFYGSGGPVDPRMRHFYGQVANVLIGQTWTTFTDVDAYPDTLDFAGPVGISLLRQAQLRYTHPLTSGQSLAFAIERPLTQAPILGTTGAAYNPAPDVVVRYRLDGSEGHVQAGALARALGYRIGERNTTQLGAGFNVGAAWNLYRRDRLQAYVVSGSGIARYVDNLAGSNADLDLDDAGTDVTPLGAFGGYVGYTHHWSSQLRSTATAGYTSINNTAGQLATAFHDSHYFSANVIWNPAGALNVGVEYLLGTHRIISGDDAHASRLQFSAKYDFFRKSVLAP